MTRPSVRDEWWGDLSGDRLLWARVRSAQDGSCEVLDVDARVHSFKSYADAKTWLMEDEYAPVAALIAAGELPVDLEVPAAADDGELLRQMRAPQLALRSFLDRRFYEALGTERPEVRCTQPKCSNGAIEQSVFCRKHHFESVMGRAYAGM